MDELKLVVGDSFENVASLQGCHFQQRDSVQTLGKILTGARFPGKQSQLVENNRQRLPEGTGGRQAAASANNAPSPLGINTKQLSNQMLELTKVVNELKDVLIQQVGALASPGLLSPTADPLVNPIRLPVPGQGDVVSQKHHLGVPGLRYAWLTAASLANAAAAG